MSKYIDADQIRAEIERQKEINEKLLDGQLRAGCLYAFNQVLSFIDTLPEQPVEETPEPYTGVYGEAYLQEKIAKATKSWEGVDVDKMLAECRGYEQPVEGLEEEIDRLWESFSEEMSGPHNLFDMYRRLARHFAEWGMNQCPLPEDTTIFLKGVAEGRRLEKDDIISLIESRIAEILGDAQPAPILRTELRELIKKIKK